MADSAAADKTSRTLYCGNLSWDTNNETLEEAFAGAGQVLKATVITYSQSGRSKGFGYVEFATAEEAQAALAMNGTEIDGRPIKLDLDSNKKETPSTTVFIGGLQSDWDEDYLAAIVAECGDVDTTRIVYDREGVSRGFGYVEFLNIASATKAVTELNDAQVDGHPIRVDYDHRQKRSTKKAKKPRGEKSQGGQQGGAKKSRGPKARKNQDKTAFVGNLSFDTEEETLQAEFGAVGEVTSVRIMKRGGNSRGFGYVEFTSVADLNAAIAQFDGFELDGRELRVSPSNAGGKSSGGNGGDNSGNQTRAQKPKRKQFERPTGPTTTVFVGNLPFSTTEDDLTDMFTPSGITMTEVRIVQGRHGNSRGFAYVTTTVETDATALIEQFTNTEIDGRVLKFDYASPKSD